MCECECQNKNDCFKCNRYYSSHSSHYDNNYKCNVVEITCSIGGHKVFDDETGRKLGE